MKGLQISAWNLKRIIHTLFLSREDSIWSPNCILYSLSLPSGKQTYSKPRSSPEKIKGDSSFCMHDIMLVTFSPSRSGKIQVVVLGRNITESLSSLFSSKKRKRKKERKKQYICNSSATIDASYGARIPCALLHKLSSLSSPSTPHGKYGWMSSWE